MIVEIRKKSQITLPKEIVKQLNLIENDQLEICIDEGNIVLTPVAIYPKQYMAKLNNEIQALKKSNDFPLNSFQGIDEVMNSLNIKDDK